MLQRICEFLLDWNLGTNSKSTSNYLRICNQKGTLTDIMAPVPPAGRIINYNKLLFGPGPVHRIPSGVGSYYGKLPPLQGFTMAAIHGIVLALAGSFIFKYSFGDPQIRTIEAYYRENPPR